MAMLLVGIRFIGGASCLLSCAGFVSRCWSEIAAANPSRVEWSFKLRVNKADSNTPRHGHGQGLGVELWTCWEQEAQRIEARRDETRRSQRQQPTGREHKVNVQTFIYVLAMEYFKALQLPWFPHTHTLAHSLKVSVCGEQAEAALLRNPNKCPSSGRWTTLTNDTRRVSLSSCQFECRTSYSSLSPPVLPVCLPVCQVVLPIQISKICREFAIGFLPRVEFGATCWRINMPAKPGRQYRPPGSLCGPCGESYPILGPREPGSQTCSCIAAFSQ